MITTEDKAKKGKKGLLFRLPYPYTKKQIYLPTDLLLVGSRLEQSGIETRMHDLNLHRLPKKEELQEYDFFGVGVIGAPYIPGAVHLVQDLADKTKQPICVGGPALEKMSPEQFARLFRDSATHISTDSNLTHFLDVDLPDLYAVSIVPMLEKIEKEDLQLYLSREFSLFVSQGCKFGCAFCGAKKKMRETFVEPDTVEENLEYIVRNAMSLGIRQLSIYLSSLDLFQNQDSFGRVLETFADMRGKYPSVEYRLRGLSRIDSFVNALKEAPELVDLVKHAGLKTIGFGVDGTTEKIWKSQHKGQVGLSQVDEALDTCKRLGITPELLMVMGFPNDDFWSLLKTYMYTVARAVTHGAVSRPYLAKSFIPGNDGWADPRYEHEVETLLENPALFANLDFAALGSPLTHPRRFQRYLSNLFYVAITMTLEPFGRNATYPLMPRTERRGLISRIYDDFCGKFNSKVPFDI
ncbi:MAG TPA: radical SAM protein [Candidatus Nanoarchaeia archaeon]|nr:radical SAM protein [Candidatus Nanoarchaeia archaeon]